MEGDGARGVRFCDDGDMLGWEGSFALVISMTHWSCTYTRLRLRRITHLLRFRWCLALCSSCLYNTLLRPVGIDQSNGLHRVWRALVNIGPSRLQNAAASAATHHRHSLGNTVPTISTLGKHVHMYL